jgi:hypothetical protein
MKFTQLLLLIVHDLFLLLTYQRCQEILHKKSMFPVKITEMKNHGNIGV